MPIKHVIFDMDGTLVSSAKTIYNTTIHTLRLFNIEKEIPENEFNSLIGLHFGDLLPVFDIHIEDMEGFINEFKTHYFEYIQYSSLYPDVIETLKELRKLGMKISILTTKGQDQTEKIVRYFNIGEYFDYLMGRRPGLGHKPSPEPLLLICKEIGIKPEDSLMVGDSELDVECGKNAGSKTASVTFGYRKKEELKLSEPDFIIDNLISLKYIISNGNTF
jgi:HAD superfamily hydrolase (TIGR01549 family)